MERHRGQRPLRRQRRPPRPGVGEIKDVFERREAQRQRARREHDVTAIAHAEMSAQERRDAEHLDAFLRQPGKQEGERLRRELQRIVAQVERRQRHRDRRAQRDADRQRVDEQPRRKCAAPQKKSEQRRRGRRDRPSQNHRERHLARTPAFRVSTKAEKPKASPIAAPMRETPPACAINARASSSPIAVARMAAIVLAAPSK